MDYTHAHSVHRVELIVFEFLSYPRVLEVNDSEGRGRDPCAWSSQLKKEPSWGLAAKLQVL
eukprot:2312046-Rhodomonas_salina.3